MGFILHRNANCKIPETAQTRGCFFFFKQKPRDFGVFFAGIQGDTIDCQPQYLVLV